MQLSQLLIIGVPQNGDLRWVRELQPGGVILMGRNAAPPTELRDFILQIQAELAIPAFVCTDHEGGRVQRFKDGFTVLPSARELAEQGECAVEKHAQMAAHELREVGVTVNFAPVCDVPTHQNDTVIGNRAFGTDAATVSRMAGAYLRGAGDTVLTCLKHFPGHGGVGVDSHFGLPTFSGGRAELGGHLAPFRELKNQAPAMMAAHIAVPEIDPTGAPCSLSRSILHGLLREEIGFDGLIFSDDLEMHALDQSKSGENGVRALRAGCDQLLFCHEGKKASVALRAIGAALKNGDLDESEIARSLGRVARAKSQLGLV